MDAANTARRREADLVRRCYAGLDAAALQAEIIRSVRALLPVDAIFVATADPSTLLFTSTLAEDPLVDATVQFLDNEFGHVDVNKFQSLVADAPHVATLDEATRGQRDDSHRSREIMTPLGFGDELRAALVTSAGCWGYLCLHRADSQHGFTPGEARLIARLATHLGNGCRQAMALPYQDVTAAGAPGVIVLHPDLTVAAITGEAEHWLTQIPNHQPDPQRLPPAVYAVAARLRNIDAATIPPGPGAAPTVRVPATTGGWLHLHASHLTGTAADDIAVIIEPAHPATMAPLLLTAMGLTPRERDVARLVLRGASTQTIGTDLYLSPHTVKDHLKSIFDKLGVRSRRDLVAHILTHRADAPH
jgi:DNA-binding CsgD family transcriptional regulator